ncbi:MAG TPA: SpoIIE family protein phosphatase [Thermomicrobiales bacterium]|nr:SpoIIE family protein phosphatase [Thermomicrobiales bacterium]
MKRTGRASRGGLARLRRACSWRRAGLRSRMALSYAVTTLVAVLVLETVVGATLWALATYGPLAGVAYLTPARQTAALYALAAEARTAGAALDPRLTFAPGQPASLALAPDDGPAAGAIPYIAPGAAARTGAAFAVLVTPDGAVLASSDPARYSPLAASRALLPGASALILHALAGAPGGAKVPAASGQAVGAAAPVRDRAGRVIGAVYVQLPAAPGAGFFRGFSRLVPLSAVVWSALTLPVGVLFGLLTTRGLVRRIDGLVAATARFAAGDYARRVPVARADEVGQLERRFNRMADRLVASMAERQRLVERQARREERARLDQELRTAWQIQQSLLPGEVPALPGWRLTPYYRPAKEVGGDFYDFHPRADGRLGIAIGDATGKGVPAALMMAITRTMLRTAAGADAAPGAILARVNDLLAADIVPGMFVTCCYALFDPRSGRLRFANAGHNPPYRQHGAGVAELLATGMPLGLLPGSRYAEAEVVLTPGDRVLFYSDGLVEAHNPARELFGFPRLGALLRAQPREASLIETLLAALGRFTGDGWEQEDDITLLTLQGACGVPDGAETAARRDGPRLLAAFDVPSAPGNERLALARVAEAVAGLALPAGALARLATAVAEATMNAMEHGNGYRPELPVRVRVLASAAELAVRISDRGRGPVGAPEAPDLAAKLAGRQAPRGWGLFLIEHLVDELRVTADERHHTVELVVRLVVPTRAPGDGQADDGA